MAPIDLVGVRTGHSFPTLFDLRLKHRRENDLFDQHISSPRYFIQKFDFSEIRKRLFELVGAAWVQTAARLF